MDISPWNIDAFRNFSKETESHLLVNEKIQTFLKIGGNDKAFFLVGAKGIGKTLFLRYKSYKYFNQFGSSFKYNVTQDDLTENLKINIDSFSKKDLIQFGELPLWETIWALTLWTMVFRIAGLEIPEELEKLLNKKRRLSPILSTLINERRKIPKLRRLINEYLENAHKISNGIAIFIDDIDQSLLDILVDTRDIEIGEAQSNIDVWVNAQIALMKTVYNMARENTHVKIHATIRREAWESYRGQLRVNLSHHVILLEYSKEELREIFDKNIQMTPGIGPFNHKSKDYIEKFLTFSKLPHRFATHRNGTPKDENAFDFIYRHTFGRPRDIIVIGRELSTVVHNPLYLNSSPMEKIDKVRKIVNDESNELFKQYSSELIPEFDENEFDEFVRHLDCNAINEQVIAKINKETLKKYFNYGLVGYPEATNVENTEMKQTFKEPSTYNYRNLEPLPSLTKYYLTHPSLDKKLMTKITYSNFYNRFDIIGKGYSFDPIEHVIPEKYERYLPKSISNNRWEASSEANTHQLPIRQYYEYVFRDNRLGNPQRYLELSREADKILSLLSRICYSKKLSKQFTDQKEHYLQVVKNNESSLVESDLLKYPYNRTLGDSITENVIEDFLHRLKGRYITAVCILVLDISINTIHHFFLNEKLDFNLKRNNNETAFRYLDRGFFIDHLNRQEPFDPNNKSHKKLKNDIFESLSPDEKVRVKDFRAATITEIEHADWIENDSHKEWIYNNIIPFVWEPKL